MDVSLYGGLIAIILRHFLQHLHQRHHQLHGMAELIAFRAKEDHFLDDSIAQLLLVR